MGDRNCRMGRGLTLHSHSRTERQIGWIDRTNPTAVAHSLVRTVYMAHPDAPYALLPLAFAGIVIGIGITVLCGILIANQGWFEQDGIRSARYAGVEGTIERVGWRRSAAARGPDWFFQVHLEKDERGFIVSADEVPASWKDRFGPPSTEGIASSGLIGKTARMLVDSTLLDQPTPYISSLRVEGRTIVPAEDPESNPSPFWIRLGLLVVYGIGIVVGVGLAGASGHHVFVCLQYWWKDG